MAAKGKLLLIPLSGEETAALAKDIARILRQDYGLEDQVELLKSKRRKDISPGTTKDHRHDLVIDAFADKEIQVDIGRNELRDTIQGKHIALVEHLLTPNRDVSVNDHIMAVRGMLDVISEVDTLGRTLVAPYFSYVRSHSVEKYKKRGFHQFDSLRRTLQDYQRDGLDTLLVIDPHSTKAEEIALQLGLDYHAINPFQSGRAINPAKLGLKGAKAEEITNRLRPFQHRYESLKKEQCTHLYLVSVDSGTEKRAENFVDRANPELTILQVYSLIAYFGKDRTSYDRAEAGFKPFSLINEANIDQEGTYIIIDDMFASGSTAKNVAKILKELGAKRVEAWTSHAVTMSHQLKEANDRSSIDHVVSLDTVPQHPELQVEYIKASADLLAAELYKAHQRLIAQR